MRGGRLDFRLVGGRIFRCEKLTCLRLECNTGINAESYQKGGLPMLTVEGLIAVISLVLTAFGLGYTIGRNSKNTRE